MSRLIIHLKDSNYIELTKKAKKKAIDEEVSLSEAIRRLLEKWINDEIQI